MSSIKDNFIQHWHQACIDDLITRCDSLSLSSSEIDNITLDSGIYCDAKSDLLKQSVSSSINSKELLTPPLVPPPPPPYNSTHNIISSANSNADLYENVEKSTRYSNSDKCSINDLLYNQHLQSQLSLSNNRSSLSRLLTEEQKHSPLSFVNYQTNIFKESLHYQEHKNNESFDGKISTFSKNQQSSCIYQEKSFLQKLNKQLHSDIRNELQLDEKKKKDVKILGACNKCQCLVTDSESACIALGNLYHSNCFTCCHCSRSLRSKVFYKDQEKIYCENDYMVFGFHKSVKICDACGHIITEAILEALGKDFHPRCFKCGICQKCLDGIPFTVDRNNNIYCILDYHNTFAPRCAVCLQPIIPSKDSDDVVRVVINDRDFHVECYRCQKCLKLLSNESNCYVWATDRSEGNIKLLCRKCYVSEIRELSRLKQY